MSAKRSGPKNSSDVNPAVDVKGLTREKPWLLPSVSQKHGWHAIRKLIGNCSLQNRKLRHLEGISLRNLTLSRPSTLSQGKTADDQALPTSLRTPTKSLALREKKLEHSRSSNDLRTPPPGREKHDGSQKGSETRNGLNVRPPLPGKVRRRSTLNWTNATPEVRQKKLEDVARSKLADTWFSLHCEGVAEPVYVSEVVEKAMNPNFRFFDLNTYGPWITRRDELTIKFWARTDSSQVYGLVVELQMHLRSLQFIGKSVRDILLSRFPQTD